MEKFADFMYYLLTSPFKRIKKSQNQWYMLFQVLGSYMDHAGEILFDAREQTMLATCDASMLQSHADDRSIVRYPGESDENYRKRIANYTEVCRLGGTNQGMILAVRKLGFDDAEIKTAMELTGVADRWAEFYVIVHQDIDKEYPIGFDILKSEVRKVKYVTAKDNYRYLFLIKIITPPAELKLKSKSVIKIDNYNYLRLDGTWSLDGSQTLDASYRKFLVKQRSRIQFTTPTGRVGSINRVITHNDWCLDGTYLLDGTKEMDAYRFEEEIV